MLDDHGVNEVMQLEQLTSELTTPTKVSKFLTSEILCMDITFSANNRNASVWQTIFSLLNTHNYINVGIRACAKIEKVFKYFRCKPKHLVNATSCCTFLYSLAIYLYIRKASLRQSFQVRGHKK